MADGLSYVNRVVVVAAVAALLFVAWRIKDVFPLTFAGVVLATVFHALAVPLARWTHLPRRLCVVLVVVAIVAMTIGSGILFGGQVAEQVQGLVQQLPTAVEKVRGRLEGTGLGRMLLDGIGGAVGGEAPLGGLKAFFSSTFGLLANTVLIFFLGLYLALEPDLYRRGAVRLVPVASRATAEQALCAAGSALRKWLTGQLVSMLVVGFLTGIGLWLIGIPFAPLLGIIAGFLEFIPFVGPVLASIPGILLALSEGTDKAFYALLVYGAVQQTENNLLMPLIQRWAVSLPPALSMLSIVGFGLLFGVLGVLFAAPLVVVAMTLVRNLYVEHALEGAPAPSTEPVTARE